LSEVIKSVGDTFRYIIIDTPSGLGTITRAALSASTFALLPLQAESLSLRSISQTLRVISHIKESENPDLQLLGIVATMVLLPKTPRFYQNTLWSSLSVLTYIRERMYMPNSEKDTCCFLGGKYPGELSVHCWLLKSKHNSRVRVALQGARWAPQRELLVYDARSF
jgi:chromosome partitioning protein